jgi:hypothetical protein
MASILTDLEGEQEMRVNVGDDFGWILLELLIFL